MSCSNPTTDGVDAPAEKMERKPKLDSTICARCKDRKGILAIRHLSYCRECLMPMLVSKFVKGLVPHLPQISTRLPTATPPPILLACSGGGASLAMIEMFHESYCHEGIRGRGRWGRIVVGWVDFGREGDAEVGRMLEDVTQKRYGFDFWRVSVEEAFEDGQLVEAGGKALGIEVAPGRVLTASIVPKATTSTMPSAYRTLLSSLPTPSHPSIQLTILTSLLARMARSLALPNTPTLVFKALTSTRAASLVIAHTALGGGFALPLLTSTVREYEGVKEVRLMGGMGGKELAWFVRERGLKARNLSDFEGKGARGSVEGLTQEFVQTLDSTHPSTVNTIARTASKLVFSPAASSSPSDAAAAFSSHPICPLCELPADPSPKEWLAQTSITSLPSISLSSSATTPSASDVASQLPVTPSLPAPPPLESALCYACLATLVSPAGAAGGNAVPLAEGAARLPSWVLPNLKREVVRRRPLPREDVAAALKEEGWLLNDEDDD